MGKEGSAVRVQKKAVCYVYSTFSCHKYHNIPALCLNTKSTILLPLCPNCYTSDPQSSTFKHTFVLARYARHTVPPGSLHITLLTCDVTSFSRHVPKFRTSTLPPTSGQKSNMILGYQFPRNQIEL